MGNDYDYDALMVDAPHSDCIMVEADHPLYILYTSGTTGMPKGVMMSQDNLTWTVQVAQEIYQWRWDQEHAVVLVPRGGLEGAFE